MMSLLAAVGTSTSGGIGGGLSNSQLEGDFASTASATPRASGSVTQPLPRFHLGNNSSSPQTSSPQLGGSGRSPRGTFSSAEANAVVLPPPHPAVLPPQPVVECGFGSAIPLDKSTRVAPNSDTDRYSGEAEGIVLGDGYPESGEVSLQSSENAVGVGGGVAAPHPASGGQELASGVPPKSTFPQSWSQMPLRKHAVEGATTAAAPGYALGSGSVPGSGSGLDSSSGNVAPVWSGGGGEVIPPIRPPRAVRLMAAAQLAVEDSPESISGGSTRVMKLSIRSTVSPAPSPSTTGPATFRRNGAASERLPMLPSTTRAPSLTVPQRSFSHAPDPTLLSSGGGGPSSFVGGGSMSGSIGASAAVAVGLPAGTRAPVRSNSTRFALVDPDGLPSVEEGLIRVRGGGGPTGVGPGGGGAVSLQVRAC